MQNFEIIVLTVIISSLFIAFILGPLFYAHSLQDKGVDVYRTKAANSPQTKDSVQAKDEIVAEIPKITSDSSLTKIKTQPMKKLTLIEILILTSCIAIIFFSEYIFIVLKDSNKAIFIGLWPPTILGLLNFFNSKRN